VAKAINTALPFEAAPTATRSESDLTVPKLRKT